MLWCKSFLLFLLAIAAYGLTDDTLSLSAADKDSKSGVVIEFDELKSRAPAEWKEEAPSNRMRYAQFILPKVKDDKSDAEVVIFKGLGGATKDNVDRWKAMFIPPDGKSLDDVAKVTTMKISGAEVTYLDISGTYKFKARPFDPKAKEERMADYRMLGVVFETKKTPYHIRLVGPAKTVESYKKGFDAWLKAFE